MKSQTRDTIVRIAPREASLRQLTIPEAEASLSRLEQLLGQEGELIITRDGVPIARVLPAGGREGIPTHVELRARMPRLSVGSEVLVREDRDARG